MRRMPRPGRYLGGNNISEVPISNARHKNFEFLARRLTGGGPLPVYNGLIDRSLEEIKPEKDSARLVSLQ